MPVRRIVIDILFNMDAILGYPSSGTEKVLQKYEVLNRSITFY